MLVRRVRCRPLADDTLWAILDTCDCTLLLMMRSWPSLTNEPEAGDEAHSSQSCFGAGSKTSADGTISRQHWVRSPTRVTNGMTTPAPGSAASVPTDVAPADVARLLLDSTVLIDALRGRPAADRLRALRRQGDEPWTCAISIEEIWRGLLPGEETAARRLVRGLRCVPLGPAEGVRAGGWRRQFATQGITLHQADCLIAAATATIEARLATGNPADFPMNDITVEHWPVGR